MADRTSPPAARPADTTEAERVRQLVARFGGLIPPNREASLVIIEKINAELDSLLAAAARRTEQAETELAEARFSPLGDNHHNAAMCPYCGEPLARALARVRDLEQALEDADEHLRMAGGLALPRVIRLNLLFARRRLRAALVSGADNDNSKEVKGG